jgi:PIN domain nuclease of toxin-antitoxin system
VKPLLLDTCAAIWMMNGDPMAQAAIEAVDDASQNGLLWVSAITAWEVALKSRPGRPDSPRLNATASEWYATLIALPGVREAPLSGTLALRSVALPELHKDPGDRFIIATAMELRAMIVTRDGEMQDYAREGLVEIFPC